MVPRSRYGLACDFFVGHPLVFIFYVITAKVAANHVHMLNLAVALKPPSPPNLRISVLICYILHLQVNVTGLVIAGSADFKSELSQSDMFDQVILSLFNVSLKCLKTVVL